MGPVSASADPVQASVGATGASVVVGAAVVGTVLVGTVLVLGGGSVASATVVVGGALVVGASLVLDGGSVASTVASRFGEATRTPTSMPMARTAARPAMIRMRPTGEVVSVTVASSPQSQPCEPEATLLQFLVGIWAATACGTVRGVRSRLERHAYVFVPELWNVRERDVWSVRCGVGECCLDP